MGSTILTICFWLFAVALAAVVLLGVAVLVYAVSASIKQDKKMREQMMKDIEEGWE